MELMMFRKVIKSVVPQPLRNILKKLAKGLRKLCMPLSLKIMDSYSNRIPPRWAFAFLRFAWGNPWAATAEYIECAIRQVASGKLRILECGSGLTSLAIGYLTRNSGAILYCLEHDEKWVIEMRAMLSRYNLKNVQVFHSPLSNYPGFQWYRVPTELSEVMFDLVLCDGPPAETQGGRMGLIEVMWSKIQHGAILLVDDTNRPQEAKMVEEWLRSFALNRQPEGTSERFSILFKTK